MGKCDRRSARDRNLLRWFWFWNGERYEAYVTLGYIPNHPMYLWLRLSKKFLSLYCYFLKLSVASIYKVYELQKSWWSRSLVRLLPDSTFLPLVLLRICETAPWIVARRMHLKFQRYREHTDEEGQTKLGAKDEQIPGCHNLWQLRQSPVLWWNPNVLCTKRVLALTSLGSKGLIIKLVRAFVNQKNTVFVSNCTKNR